MSAQPNEHLASQLELAARIAREDLPWQCRYKSGITWHDGSSRTQFSIVGLITQGCEIRLKPWVMPTPPNGMEYCNPENVPLDKVPYGWRFLVKEEWGEIDGRCRMWGYPRFTNEACYGGSPQINTYIVPADTPFPEPWKLPESPEGRAWHRTDWSKDMLPEGYRPLLLGEERQIDDEMLARFTGLWTMCREVGEDCRTGPVGPGNTFFRTKRPLPEPEKAPEAETKLAPLKGGFSIQEIVDENKKLRADCAAMREALEEAEKWMTHGCCHLRSIEDVRGKVIKTLSTDAGKSLLEERDKLRGDIKTTMDVLQDFDGDNVWEQAQQAVSKIDVLTAERDRLARWKREQMEVESSWDCQKVGELLGIGLGQMIRPQIEPKIRELIAERDALRLALNACKPKLKPFSSIFQSPPPVSNAPNLVQVIDGSLKGAYESLEKARNELREAHEILKPFEGADIIERARDAVALWEKWRHVSGRYSTLKCDHEELLGEIRSIVEATPESLRQRFGELSDREIGLIRKALEMASEGRAE